MNFRPCRLLFTLMCCVMTVACTTPQSEVPSVTSSYSIVWPPAPAKARVTFLQSFHEPQDLGIRPSAFRRFMSSIAGKKDLGMTRPYAISVYQQTILVGDPGLHAVHMFNPESHSYSAISTLGKQSLISPVGVTQSNDRLFISDSVLGKVFILDRKGKLLNTIDHLQRPTGLTFDLASNRLYVADTLSHRVVVFDQDGQQLFEIGKRGAEDGEFNFPSHIFISEGTLLVNDNMNFRIQIFDAEGKHLSTFGTHGDGSGDFSQPKGVAADSDGNIYVAGATIDRLQVFSAQGEFLLPLGSKGNGPGQFMMPTGISISENKIYVADSLNQRIQVLEYIGGN
jgi:DNA-binding beta-propeller fold protein YncE